MSHRPPTSANGMRRHDDQESLARGTRTTSSTNTGASTAGTTIFQAMRRHARDTRTDPTRRSITGRHLDLIRDGICRSRTESAGSAAGNRHRNLSRTGGHSRF